MQVGNVQKLISIFKQSFHQLGVTVSLDKLETLSVTIHRAMTTQARHFHTLEHVFNFVDPENAILSLAALYHDIVYYQVDMGFSPHVWELISPYIRRENDNFSVVENIPVVDRQFFMTLDIFELVPGQQLTSLTAMNEFLSALVMQKQLSGLVSEKDLALMTLCIEATIPFRGFFADGRNHFDYLEQRLPSVFDRYGLAISSEDLIEGIKTAVVFANKDIENFAEGDPGVFLDSTWKLLPETNAALRLPDVYSIGAYRHALLNMKVFFDNLNPDTVFCQYRGVPVQELFEQMSQIAHDNVRIASQYLGIKILGTTILEALALCTGGDAPLSLFLGDIPREGVTIKRLEYFLPELDDPSWVEHNSIIYQLLESGRASDVSFDMKNSPLSLFVYKSVPPDTLASYLKLAQSFFDGQISPEGYLKSLDTTMVHAIARASSVMVYTRRQVLLNYAGEG